MLCNLKISNFILIDELDLEFSRGLNIFTGETGAGKSLIMKALNLLMGSRPEGKTTRNDNENTVVEALFNLSESPDIINQINNIAGLDIPKDEEEIILRRFISSTNRSTARINNNVITMWMLKKIGYLLINIHNQHHTQKLLKKENHMPMLDSFGPEEHINNCIYYKELYRNTKLEAEKIQALKQKIIKKERELDILNYQAREIDELDLLNINEKELDEKRKIQSNHEQIIETLSFAIEKLNSNYNSGLLSQLGQINSSLTKISAFSNQLEEIADTFEQARIEIEEGLRLIEDYKDTLVWNPAEAESLDALISSIEDLKRKFGPALEDILNYRKEISFKIDSWENVEKELFELNKSYKKNISMLSEIAEKISNTRVDSGLKLKKALEKELKDLGITNPAISFNIKQNKQIKCLESFRPDGTDELEITAAFNKGEKPAPIEKVASGGELSRVMLCLKSIFQNSANTLESTMVFDEIDIGISGRTAEMAGKKMKEIAGKTQILAITHLPQIASMGKAHFLVKKSENSKNVFTSVKKLNYQERIEALAGMLGSEGKTATAHAQNLLIQNQTL
jgi:DNA repair protein RecN (Recombination protein N)